FYYPRPALFRLFGLSSGAVFWVNGLLLVLFCFSVAVLYRPGRIKLLSFLWVLAEGFAWSLFFFLCNILLHKKLGVNLLGFEAGPTWLLFASASFYDALLFVWGIPAAFAALLRLILGERKKMIEALVIFLSGAVYLLVYPPVNQWVLLIRGLA